jgi:hypothetical protein
MIFTHVTRYTNNSPEQFINQPIGVWGDFMFRKVNMLRTFRYISDTIPYPNKKYLWKHGYNFIGYNKAYYRWRRSVHNYYVHNK